MDVRSKHMRSERSSEMLQTTLPALVEETKRIQAFVDARDRRELKTLSAENLNKHRPEANKTFCAARNRTCLLTFKKWLDFL